MDYFEQCALQKEQIIALFVEWYELIVNYYELIENITEPFY